MSGATAPDNDVGDPSVVDITTKEVVNLRMEDVKDVKGDDGLARDAKLEAGDTGELNDYDSVTGDGPREVEDHGKCKLGNKDKKLKDLDDMKAYDEAKEAGEHEEKYVAFEKTEDVKGDGKPKNKDADSDKQEKVDNLVDSHYQGNGKSRELRSKGDTKKQAIEESKEQLTKCDELVKNDAVDDVEGKTDNKGGLDGGNKAEGLEKYEGKKHSEKLNRQGGVDTTGDAQGLKGESEKNENELPIEKMEENGEHDEEGSELKKLEEQHVKDEENIFEEKMSSNEVKQENDEKNKMEKEKGLDDNDSEDDEEVVDSDNEEKESEMKPSRGKRARASSEKKKNGRKTFQEEPTTPGLFADRPVRERKTVVRLVEVIEKEQGEGLHIEQGRGIPLKDIPNVAYKLSRRKPEDVKLLHSILFGRKGKAADFKSHISQFSGFVWLENEEKQKAKVKDKLEKCARLNLLDLCDLFDISVSRATTKKEDIIEKLLDFLIAPHPTTDVISTKEQHSSVKRKMSPGESSSGTFGSSSKLLKKRRTGSGFKNSADKGMPDTKVKDEKSGEEDKEGSRNGLFSRDEGSDRSASEKEDNSIEKVDTEGFGISEKKESKKEKSTLAKKSPYLKNVSPLSSGSGSKKSASKHLKAEETHDSEPKVFSRREKVNETTKKRPSKPVSGVKDTGRKLGTSKPKSDKADETEPSKDALRKMISVILKEVDFNTATFKDILKQLGNRFKTDLAHMKEEIKLMTKEELVKIAEEEANSDDDEDASDDEKNVQPATKKHRT